MNPDVEFAGWAFTVTAGDGIHGDFDFFFQNKSDLASGPGPFTPFGALTPGIRVTVTYEHSSVR